MNLIRALAAWRARPDSSDAWLAWRLGYKSSTVITNWIQRGVIPKAAVTPLTQIMKEEKAL